MGERRTRVVVMPMTDSATETPETAAAAAAAPVETRKAPCLDSFLWAMMILRRKVPNLAKSVRWAMMMAT